MSMSDIPKSLELRSPIRVTGFPMNNNEVFDMLFDLKSKCSLSDEETSPPAFEAEQECEDLSQDGVTAESRDIITELLDSLIADCIPLRAVSHVMARVVEPAVVSTPEDLPRIKCRSPAQPSKSLPSPPPADCQLAKRSLFDSPAPARVSSLGFSDYRNSPLIMPDVNTPVKTASQDTPKSVKFSEKSPERISPKPVQDTHTDTDVTFLLMKIKSMSMAEVRSEPEPELSFSMPANLDLPEFSADISHSDVSGDLLPLTPINLEASVIASHGGDFSLRPQNLGLTSTLSTHLTTLALQHEAELLEKDKEIAALQKEMAEMENEEVKVIEEIRSVDHRNASLRIAVSNLEESVDNIHLKHENDVEGLRMSQSRASQDISVAQTDLQNVKRALQDISSRYTRTRASIMDMQEEEDRLKVEVSHMQEKLKKDLARYDVLKNDANEKLAIANGKMDVAKKSGEAQIMKLRAMLKKEEMRVKSLEGDVEKKTRENEELTQICDQLISRVGL